MNDLFDHADKQNSPVSRSASPSVSEQVVQVDPKLLDRALKKIRGLVRGNGIKTEDVHLGQHHVRMYRFRARSFLRLGTEHSAKIEPGRNNKCEALPPDISLQQALSQVVMDARIIPDKRQRIVDFMISRPDKGFGVHGMRVKFPFLDRHFVQHEKCVGCKGAGRVGCSKCHGNGMVPCVNCQGRRQVVCPRCRGTTKIQANNKTIPCTYCRADGKINCPKCAGRGQQKCQICAASGSMQCQPCASTGWVSHTTYIETYAQVFFDFDREILPSAFVQLIEKDAAKFVAKGDVEASIVKSMGVGTAENKQSPEKEPDDMIWIDYEAQAPYGDINFQLKGRDLPANLFGFQSRLQDCPPFLEGLTKSGQQDLMTAATGNCDVAETLRSAAKFFFIRDVITQTLQLKSHAKVHQLMAAKYATGIRPTVFPELIQAADVAVRRITRKPRIVGLSIGLSVFAAVSAFYFLGGGRSMVSLPPAGLMGIDLILPIMGTVLVVVSAKFSARLSQDKALKGIVADDILKHLLPKAGKTIWWASAISIVIVCGLLAIAFEQGQAPEWVQALFR